jgi:hypothetical protein
MKINLKKINKEKAKPWLWAGATLAAIAANEFAIVPRTITEYSSVIHQKIYEWGHDGLNLLERSLLYGSLIKSTYSSFREHYSKPQSRSQVKKGLKQKLREWAAIGLIPAVILTYPSQSANIAKKALHQLKDVGYGIGRTIMEHRPKLIQVPDKTLENVIEDTTTPNNANSSATANHDDNTLHSPPFEINHNLYEAYAKKLSSNKVFRKYTRTKKNGKKETIKLVYKTDTTMRLNGALNHYYIFEKGADFVISKHPALKELKDKLMYVSIATIAQESAGKNATSRAGAKGPCQYMKRTALARGMRIDKFLDERVDAEYCIPATMNMLTELAIKYNSMESALAAYNAGEGALKRAMKKANSADFQEYGKYLPSETRKYVPKILAMANILSNPKKYGIKLQPRTSPPYIVEIIKQGEWPYMYVRKYSIPIEEIKKLNPALRKLGFVPPYYPLKIPKKG